MPRRRQFLRGAAFGAGAAVVASCERVVSGFGNSLAPLPARLAPAEGAAIDPDFHLLSRAAFGPWPGDLERLRAMGRAAWLEEQLDPESIDDSLCDLRARRFESLFVAPGDAYEFRKPVLRGELTRHALLRAVYSKRQLFEAMVEFWSDHLNIDIEKGDCVYLKPSDDREVIRRHALGRFRDLVRASVTSPAMLVYLDGASNKVRRGGADVPNENHARELLELHTLGVHGGYTQADVREAARCLSGWTFDVKRRGAANRGRSHFRADWHDDGPKRVLGHGLPAGGGPRDLERLVDIVCDHPATATHLAAKLCRHFVSQDPPPALVARVADEFRRSGGEIRPVLRTLFGSEEFAGTRGNLLKRPFRFVVSALRALAADTHARQDGPLAGSLQRMGHGLFQHPTPDGYPDEEAPWMGTLMWRWNFAFALAGGTLAGVAVPFDALHQALAGGLAPGEAFARWFAHLHGRAPNAAESTAFAPWTGGGDPAPFRPEAPGLMLAGPAFQRC